MKPAAIVNFLKNNIEKNQSYIKVWLIGFPGPMTLKDPIHNFQEGVLKGTNAHSLEKEYIDTKSIIKLSTDSGK